MNEFPLVQHGETHKVGGADPLDSESLANAINLADLAEKLHSSLTGVTTSQHHVKTVSGDIDHGSINGLADDDHGDYYNEARGDARYLKLAGGVLVGFLTLHAAPTADLHASTKKYVDDNIGIGVRGIIFNLGFAYVDTKQAQALIPSSYTISKVKIYADTAPTGASLIVDVNKNGTTIFTAQANRPEIAIDGHADDSGTPDVTAIAAGDRLSVDVDQVGSTVAGGNDLLVVIVCQ